MPVSGALFDMDKLASVSRDVISKMSEETLFDEISVWAKDNDEKLNAYITASPDNVQRKHKAVEIQRQEGTQGYSKVERSVRDVPVSLRRRR